MARYALNIADLTILPKLPVSLMVAPHIQDREIANSDHRLLDECAVVLECPEEQASAICVLCATQLSKDAPYACRFYKEGSRGGWHKLTKSEVVKLDRELRMKGVAE